MTPKIIASLVAIATVAAVAGGATVAYFSDTETSTDNTFAAGTLDLKVDGNDTVTAINLSNKKPGDAAEAAVWLLRNNGSLPGTLSFQTGAVTNTDNTPTDFEAWTGTPLAPVQPGELGGKMTIAMWMDKDGDGTYEDGDYYLKNDGTLVDFATDGTINYYTADSLASKTWTTATPVSATTDAGKFRVQYDFPNAVDNTDNIAQGDGLKFDLTFGLKQ